MELAAVFPDESTSILFVLSPCVDPVADIVTSHLLNVPQNLTDSVLLYAHVRRYRLLSANSPLSFDNYESAAAAVDAVQRAIAAREAHNAVPRRIVPMIAAENDSSFDDMLSKQIRGLSVKLREVVCPLPLTGQGVPGLRRWKATLAERIESCLYHGNVVAPLVLPARRLASLPSTDRPNRRVLLLVDTNRLFMKLPPTVTMLARLMLGTNKTFAQVVGCFTAPAVAMATATDVTGGGPTMETGSWSEQYRASQALAEETVSRVAAALEPEEGKSYVNTSVSSEDAREQILTWQNASKEQAQLYVIVERRMLGSSVVLTKPQQWWRSYFVRSVLDRLLVEFGDDITFCIA